MSERLGGVDYLKYKVDQLNKIWSKFPKHLRPDVEGFKKNLRVVNQMPQKMTLSSFYEGLKPDIKIRAQQIQESYDVPQTIYTDYQTNITYVNEEFIKEAPERTLEYYLAFQIGSYSFMKPQIINGSKFDQEETKRVTEFTKAFCDEIPATEDLQIIRRGFQRQLVYKDEQQKNWYMGDFPPKGGWDNQKQFDLLNEIYPHAFALITQALVNRNGNIEQLQKDIDEGKLTAQIDFLEDALSFSMGVFYLIKFGADNNIWSLFEGLMSGNTNEVDKSFHPADKKEGSPFRFLVNSLENDQIMIMEFVMKMQAQALMSEKLRKAKFN